MTLRAIFFDLGGVIVRTEYQAPREHLAERLNLTYEEISRIVFDSDSSRKASLGTLTVDKHWAAVAHRVGLPVSESNAIRSEFFAGDVVDRNLLVFIRSLRPRYKTGVISNAWQDMRDYVQANGFADAFDTLIISAELGVMKPEPKIFRFAVEQLDIKIPEAVFVDDTPFNVDAACALGMRGILFQSSPQVIKELQALLT